MRVTEKFGYGYLTLSGMSQGVTCDPAGLIVNSTGRTLNKQLI